MVKYIPLSITKLIINKIKVIKLIIKVWSYGLIIDQNISLMYQYFKSSQPRTTIMGCSEKEKKQTKTKQKQSICKTQHINLRK